MPSLQSLFSPSSLSVSVQGICFSLHDYSICYKLRIDRIFDTLMSLNIPFRVFSASIFDRVKMHRVLDLASVLLHVQNSIAPSSIEYALVSEAAPQMVLA